MLYPDMHKFRTRNKDKVRTEKNTVGVHEMSLE